MIILVTGSRYRTVIDVKTVLDNYIGAVTRIVTGGYTGADEGARAWAREHNVPLTVFDEEAEDLPIAGERPDLCLAFPAHGSTDTWTCVEKAKRAGVPVTVVPGDDGPARDVMGSAYMEMTDVDVSNMRASVKDNVQRYREALKRLADL